MLEPIDNESLGSLIGRFYRAYMERFEEFAQGVDDEAQEPIPALAASTLELVRVNGGRALHFFFTEPSEKRIHVMRRITKVHDIEVWPASTHELKNLAKRDPDAHRNQVRRTAAIEAAVYVHFVVYPQDGQLQQILEHVAGMVARREVQGARRRRLEGDSDALEGDEGDGGDVHAVHHQYIEPEGPVRAFDSGAKDLQGAADDWFHVEK